MTPVPGDRVKVRHPCIWPELAGLEGVVIEKDVDAPLRELDCVVVLDLYPDGLQVFDVRHVEVITPPELVGMGEIAERLGVKRNTVTVWRSRGLLPQPHTFVAHGGGARAAQMPIWRWEDVEAFARKTGRLLV